MAKITEIIPKQNFEIIRDQIGAILADELNNQKNLQPVYLSENVTVFSERITSVDKSEEVVVNVLLDSLNSNYKTESDQQNRTSFFIDIYAHGKANSNDPGDKVTAFKLQKYLGICRYILQSHKYVTLDLPTGTIGGKNVDNIQIYDSQNSQDGNYSRMGRIIFSVRIMENQAIWAGVPLTNNSTKVKLDLTDEGYQYKIIN